MLSERRRPGITAAGIGVSILLILASCSEAPVTPQQEEYAAGVPLLNFSSEFDQYQFLGFVKDSVANDTPAQSDLNAFTRADNVVGRIAVKWVWDDVNSWTGSGQTGDACALFDTTPASANKGKGNANFAVCVRISNPNGDPTVVAQLATGSPLLYSCGDTKADRCASSIKSLTPTGIVCEVEKIAGEAFFTDGDDGADVYAACSIPLSLMGTSVPPNLLNVCSFPSGSPNSNPFDCVVTPGAGFFLITKATTPQNSGQTFSFTITPGLGTNGSQSITDNTTGDEQTAIIAAAPGTEAYSVAEGTLASGWTLNAAGCAFQRAGSPATGTKVGSSVNGVSVESGETTICTFDNRVLAPTISVAKTPTPSSIPETGGTVSYGVVVTNNATIPVTLASLVDSVFGDLNGVGSCNHTSAPANPYGTIAANGGTYSCTFSEALGASNAGATHVNKVTASVTSDGGPATAIARATVTYTNVAPDISVTKSADITSFTAVGGANPDNFTPNATFARGSTGTTSTTTPAFYGEVCDDEGANDEPAQSDMDCFSRADNVTGYLYVRWTWDDINSWTGAGQTGDACALLDSDGDGLANFAYCARIANPGGDPNVIAQVAGSPILYSCKDKGNDRCSPIAVKTIDTSLSSCTVTKVGEHFAAGEDGQDTQAECKLLLSELGNNTSIQNVDLVNVCSFPSGEPNSNPFDCVVLPGAGFLVLHEVTSPSNSESYFGFRLRNSSFAVTAAATNGDSAFAVQGGATSSAIPVRPGTYSLGQLMPSGWALGSISCIKDADTMNGTSSPQLNIPIAQGQTTICTFNNSLTASRTITFTVRVTNNSLEDVTLFSLEDSEHPDAADPGYSSANLGTCGSGGTIVYGTPYQCTFTRVVSGTSGTRHEDKIKAVGHDNDNTSDTKYSAKVTVVIN